VEGLVKLGSIQDDYYRFEERQRYLVGERRRRTFRTGDPVTVQVIRVNPDEGWIDFALNESQPRARSIHRRGPVRVVRRHQRRRK
jgi:ribonuclease R